MIGILTLVSADNCGSLLQAFALQYYIQKSLGLKAELIPFFPANARKMYRVLHPSVLKNPTLTWSTLKNLHRLIRQKKDYDAFRKDSLQLPEYKILDADSLWEYCKKYDQIIIGSDQVWNVRMFDFDDAYFLRGFKGRKISYAASLGGNENDGIPEKLISFRDCIEDFSCVSVREPKGKSMLEAVADKPVSLCIDPTLLIERRVWNDLASERMIKEDYIFFYSYNYGDNQLNALVQKCAERHHLPVYVINASRWIGKSPSDFNFRLCHQGGPMAFLNLMRHARFTFAQSLHGSIFATIFRTNFWFLSNRETDELDPRSENILSLLGVRDRVLRPNNLETTDISKEPNYLSFNLVLDEARASSVAYLKQNLLCQ